MHFFLCFETNQFCTVLLMPTMGQVALTSTTAARDPCKAKVQTTPHETYCDKYYACVANQTVEKSCPNGLAYLGHTSRGRFSVFGHCDYDFNVDCSGRPQRSNSIYYFIYICICSVWNCLWTTIC